MENQSRLNMVNDQRVGQQTINGWPVAGSSWRALPLPAQEPPPDVLAAIRVVVAWTRQVEREEEARRQALALEMQKAQQQAMLKRPRDWRDEL